ncbi:MAG: flagellar biosynthetic protein FliO [Thermoleophilia bacterium]|nr:flagellar biosynthetic protein FliO [Thermoleophilia bacterium]
MGSDAIIATLLLGTMCLAMWWLARIAKRRMGVGAGVVSGDGLKVVGKRPLDQKNALYVIEIAGGRHILVGASADGGGISKVDDISADEYAAMVAEPEPSSRPKLRLAGRTAKPDVSSTGATEQTGDDDQAADEQRFATVGESFNALLGKARDARAARRDRASGDD